MLQSRAAQHEPGMDVAGERVARVRDGGLVAEHERRNERGRVAAVDAQVGRRIARVAVVVAADQRDLEAGAQ